MLSQSSAKSHGQQHTLYNGVMACSPPTNTSFITVQCVIAGCTSCLICSRKPSWLPSGPSNTKAKLFRVALHGESCRGHGRVYTPVDLIVCVWDIFMRVTNAGFNFSSVQRSHWECDECLLRAGGLPIVGLSSGRPPLLTVCSDLLQHTEEIWSNTARVNHPDTAKLDILSQQIQLNRP